MKKVTSSKIMRNTNKVSVYTNSLEWWKDFYKVEFGIETNLTENQLPGRPIEDNWRLIVVVKGIDITSVCKKLTKKFKQKIVNTEWDTATELTYFEKMKNDRDPNLDGTYCIWVRDTIEADEQFKNMSAYMSWQKGIKGVTLLEHLLHALAYWIETGTHLDVKNSTLCSGTRLSYALGSFVPRVHSAKFPAYDQPCIHIRSSVQCHYYSEDLRIREIVK